MSMGQGTIYVGRILCNALHSMILDGKVDSIYIFHDNRASEIDLVMIANPTLSMTI